jgi:hypothetical protein
MATTNAKLRRMDDLDQHRAIYAALVEARLEDVIPRRWSVEDHEGCDTV